MTCYSNCPGENWHGDCVKPKMQGTPHAHCYEEEDEPDLTCPTCKGRGVDETGVLECEICRGEGMLDL